MHGCDHQQANSPLRLGHASRSTVDGLQLPALWQRHLPHFRCVGRRYPALPASSGWPFVGPRQKGSTAKLHHLADGLLLGQQFFRGITHYKIRPTPIKRAPSWSWKSSQFNAGNHIRYLLKNEAIYDSYSSPSSLSASSSSFS